MVIENQKRNLSKQRKKNKIKEGEDMISKLPDALLLNILSFLQMKCIVSTSILSKRWRYLWTFIQVLDFRDYDDDDTVHPTHPSLRYLQRKTNEFMNFVDGVLSQLDDKSNIKKLYLDCDSFFHGCRIDTWVSIAVKRNVEEIGISLLAANHFLIPYCIFTCESLTTLEIDMDTHLFIYGSISMPKLRILRLTHVKFVDENLPQIFASNCSALEEMSFTRCLLKGSENVLSISSPTLQFLSLEENFWTDDINVVSITAPALEFLSLNRNDNFGCGIMICAPKLVILDYRQSVTKDFDVHDGFISLLGAIVDFQYVETAPGNLLTNFDETGFAASKFMGWFSNVKDLNISGATFKALSFADNLLTSLPKFHNLINLEVCTLFPCSTSRTLLDFLQILPNLTTLTFAEGFGRDLSNDDDNGWTLNLVPQCLLLHLKSVQFLVFHGYPGELNAVKLFLKYAGILEMMSIIFSPNFSTKMKNKILEKLHKFPRGCQSCEIKYY